MSFSDLFKTKKETPKCSAVIVAAGSSKRMSHFTVVLTDD